MPPTPLPYMTPVPVSMAPVWVQAARVSVPAGFPSPAEDHLVDRIELMSQLVRHPQATFFVRIAGDSMQGAAAQCSHKSQPAPREPDDQAALPKCCIAWQKLSCLQAETRRQDG